MNVVTVLTQQEKDNFGTLEYFLSMDDSEHLAQEALDRLLHLAGIAGDHWGVSRSSAVSIISCAGRLGVLGFDYDNSNFDSDKFEMEKKRILHSDNSDDWWSDRNAFYDAITRDPENIFNFDEDVWVEAKAYRAEGKDRMANQTLNIDGVLFLQKHFQQNITKAPMWPQGAQLGDTVDDYLLGPCTCAVRRMMIPERKLIEVQTKVPYLDLTGVGEVYLDFLHVQSLLQERPTYPGWAIWEDFSHIQL